MGGCGWGRVEDVEARREEVERVFVDGKEERVGRDGTRGMEDWGSGIGGRRASSMRRMERMRLR